VNLYFVVRRPKFCANEIIHLWNCLTLKYTRRKNDSRVIRCLIDRPLRKLSFCCCRGCMLDVHISFKESFVVHFNSRYYYLKISVYSYCFKTIKLPRPLHFRSLVFSKFSLKGIPLFFVLLGQNRAQFYLFFILCCFEFYWSKTNLKNLDSNLLK